MTLRYVYGIYSDVMAAENQADKLVREGVPQQAISIVATDRARSNQQTKYHFIPAVETMDDRNWFQKLFNLQEENQPADSRDFSDYADSLNKDKILLVVDSEYEGILGEGVNSDTRQGDNIKEYPGTVHEDSPTGSPFSKDRPLVDDALTGEAVYGDPQLTKDPLMKPDRIVDEESNKRLDN